MIAQSILAFSPSFHAGSLWMLLSLGCFTGNALLLKYAGSNLGVSAWLALLFRALGGATVVWVLFASGGRVDFKRAVTNRMLVSRGILGAFGTAAYYVTIPVLGAGKATLIGNTWVIWSAVIAAFVLKESLGWSKVAGIVVALGGLGLLTGVDRAALGHFGRFEHVAIAGALVAAATVVVIRQLTRTETSATIYTSQCAFTALLALPMVAAQWRAPSLLAVILLSAAAALAAFGQLAMTEGFRHLTVTVGGAYQVLLPLTITLSSVILFHEPFTLAQIGGAGLILAGCLQTVAGRGGARAPAVRRGAG